MDAALDKFNQMVNQGVSPNKAVYQCLVLGSCSHGHFVKAKELISEAINRGLYSNSVFSYRVINDLCKEGKVKEAQDMFDFILGIGQRPDVIMYNSLMDGY